MSTLSFTRRAAVTACISITCAAQTGADATTRVMHAYHVGNSLTFGAFPNNATVKLFESRGGAYTRGAHILWGSPLARIWENPASNNAPVAPFGSFSNALTAFDWDVLTLQPYASTIAGDRGDLVQCRRFIELAARRNPHIQTYVYETWPPRPGTNTPAGFATAWDAPYTGQRTGGVPCRDYCAQLVRQLRAELPALKRPVRLIPAGDVLYALDALMRAGRVPGFTSARDLYNDGIHLNAVGNYAVQCTFYAVLFGQSPVGLPGKAHSAAVSDDLARVIQETVWRVVCANELTGCTPGENAAAARVQSNDCIWWEGEDAVEQLPATPALWHLFEGAGFSAGKMLQCSAAEGALPAQGARATWRVTVPADGEYEFWARLGWRPWSSHAWRFDAQPWNECDTSGGFFEFIKVPTARGLVEACWAPYGRVTLKAGAHTFQVRFMPSAQQRHALQNFDCFVLSRTPFVPAGQFKPADAVPVNALSGSLANNTWWALHPQIDAAQRPVLDLSFMNDPVGTHGAVTMKDGDLFFEDGTPVRFWGPNVSYWQGNLVYMEHLAADRFAAFLAQLGVNIVRVHILHAINSLIDPSRNDTQEFDKGKLDRLDYLIYALGTRGIYVNIDMMYHRMFKPGDGVGEELCMPAEGNRRGTPEYNVSWACGAASFWHPRVIELNLALYKKLLTHVNPYTKKSLAEMPQLAMCTIHNEQSLFWGTSNIRRGRTAEILDQIYSAWLKNKYGTHAKLAAAWQVPQQPSPFNPGENLDTGIVNVGPIVMGAYGKNTNRGADQVKFLYEMETGFYQNVIAAMRSWGVKCPLITSNWQGGGNTTRLVLQASTLGDVVDRHIYFSKPVTMLDAVGKGLPMIGFDQQAGRAFSVSEWNHGSDGRYMAESVPLMATVGAIQGWDALFQFCAGAPTWPATLGAIAPGQYALYPLAAMIFRRGDIATGPVVFERRRDPAFQFSAKPEARADTTDPAALTFRDTPTANAPARVPPEALAIGRIQNAYVGTPTPDLLDAATIARCWDRTNGIVTSAAGDVQWHYKDAWVLLDSDRTQGAFGALRGKTVAARDVQVATSNAHAAILVTALETKPIRVASRLLVAAVGRAQGNGILDPTTGTCVDAPPCLMEPVTGTLAIRTPLNTVTALSSTGYPVSRVATTRAGDLLCFTLSGAPQVLYYEIR